MQWETFKGVTVPSDIILRNGINDEGQPQTEEFIQFQWHSITPQSDAFYEPLRQLPFQPSHLSELDAFLNRQEPK